MDNISRRSFLMFATGAISAPHALPPWPEIAEVPRLLDHILLGSNDLDGGLLPFFIEWSRDSVHPSVDAPKGCTLTRFEAATPQREDLLHAIPRVQLDLHVQTFDHPSLRATVSSPMGQFSVAS